MTCFPYNLGNDFMHFPIIKCCENKNEWEFIPRSRDEIRRIGCIEKIDNIERIGRIDELGELVALRELVKLINLLEMWDLGELVVLAVNW